MKIIFKNPLRVTVIMALYLVVLTLFASVGCSEPKTDFSNIENLYAQPLPVIQRCVEGKWKWYVSIGGLIAYYYSDNTFVDIKEDHYVVDYEDGSQQTFYFTWEKYDVTGIGQTYVMWDKQRNEAGWYFVSIKNDTLTVASSLPTGPDIPNRFGFVRIK